MKLTTRYIKQMTDQAVAATLGTKSKLDKARQLFSSASAQIVTAGLQREPLSIIEIRRMELASVVRIAEVLGVELTTEDVRSSMDQDMS